MTQTTDWPEVESKVHYAGRWPAVCLGLFFVVVAIVGYFTQARHVTPGREFWVAVICWGTFGVLGTLALVLGLWRIVFPLRIRHAAPDVLPDVSTEPVVVEGSVASGRVRYELVEEPEGWEFRPASRFWHGDLIFLLGFGIPFLIFAAGALSWIFHEQPQTGGWAVAILAGTTITLFCGGTVFLLAGMVLRSAYRRLCSINIPRHRADLQLELPADNDLSKQGIFEWVFVGEKNRQRMTIPRDAVVAVQLCPWKYVMGSSNDLTIRWTVQGLLVLKRPFETSYRRLPIMLSCEFARAARVMKELADTLDVPFVFSADAAGWEAETRRADSAATQSRLHASLAHSNRSQLPTDPDDSLNSHPPSVTLEWFVLLTWIRSRL